MELLCKSSSFINFLGLVVYMAFETWLGKTKKVKAGSTLELIWNCLRFISSQTWRKRMLEGKEVEGKVGTFGSYSADLTDKGMMIINVQVEVDLVNEAKKLALKTNTKVDDNAIAWLEMLMGRNMASVQAE